MCQHDPLHCRTFSNTYLRNSGDMNHVFRTLLHHALLLVPKHRGFRLRLYMAFYHNGFLLFDPDDSRNIRNDGSN